MEAWWPPKLAAGIVVDVERAAPSPAEPTDEALVERVARQDPVAFGFLYDRYGRVVYTLAAHLLGSSPAEEVVQDVFFTLWTKAGQFDPERGRFESWFLAIARHRVLSVLRERSQTQRLFAVGELETLLNDVVDPSTNVEDVAWQHERGQEILRALRRLPEDQRRVLVLAYFGGLSQSTLAERLGWPLGTVKKRVRLGLQKLRAALAEDGASEHAPPASGRVTVERASG